MNTRDWPIRSKLTALVVVPVTALLALWIFATTLTFGPALDLLAARTLLYDLGRPGETVVAELQRERRISVVHLASPRTVCDQQSAGCVLPALREQRDRTDAAVTELRRRVSGEKFRDAAGELLEARLDRLLGKLEALPAGRESIDRRELDRVGAVGLYSDMVSAAFHTFEALANLPDQDLNREARALTDLGRSRELLGQTDALLAGALTGGGFAKGEHTMLVQSIGNQWFLIQSAVADLPAPEQAAYQRLAEQEGFERLRAMQDELIAAGPSARITVDARAWQAGYDTVQQSLRDFELTQADGLADRSVPMAVSILTRLAGAGLLGLVAVVVSLVVAVRVGRSLAQRLTLMRGRLKETAEKRLPDVVDRLRRGEQVDVARETPVADRGADEIGQVAQAFTEVQKVAIRAAQVEVTLRRGLNEVFLNIARRSQGLVHRQLALLDRLERDAEDPDHLAELFRVDHLATRLRRHAEDLVILAGATPGRGWREPVAMVDLIRGAISEVESYDRVEITTLQPAGTVGRVVGDAIHLLAELIENATAFSPPESRVEVSGEHVAHGYALSVSDHGLGMTAEAIEEANRKLARAPEFDPAETARLGLFVVARLAGRHGIRVRLRRSDGSGLTAVVLIPAELITAEPSSLPAPDKPESGDDTAMEQRRLVRASRLTTVPRPRSRSATRAAPTSDSPQPSSGSAANLGGPRQASTVGPADSDGLPRRIRRRPPARSTAAAVPEPTAEAVSESAAAAVSETDAGTAGPVVETAGSSPQAAVGPTVAEAVPGVVASEGRTAADRDRAVVDSPTVQLPALTHRPTGSAAIDGPTLRQPVVAARGAAGRLGEPMPRSPEEARRFMSALQSGTARGRLAAAGPDSAVGGPEPTDGRAGSTALPGAGSGQPTAQPGTGSAGGVAAANQEPTTDEAGPPPGGPVTVESLTATERDA
ncbi:nitrate- and nitrite sensing domain-containing protein [Micromonospora sp. NPDC051196]|uniref:nitrate- and nitrite sensing domain-containing protein n=1 Tax=Micromonospora sp. NPDC051196 TaxID=3155281 RepID=UPI003427FFC8